MPKVLDRPAVRVAMRLWKSDYYYIQRVLATTDVTANEIIRTAIAKFVQSARDRERRRQDNLTLPQIEVDLESLYPPQAQSEPNASADESTPPED